jgi:hypothetical protein
MRAFSVLAILCLSACAVAPKPISIQFSNTTSSPVRVLVHEVFVIHWMSGRPFTVAVWSAPPGESTYRSYACGGLQLQSPANTIRIDQRSASGADAPELSLRVAIKPTPPEAVHVVTITSNERNRQGTLPHENTAPHFDWEESVLYADPVPVLIVHPDGSETRQTEFPSYLYARPGPDATQIQLDEAKRFAVAAEKAGGRERMRCSERDLLNAMKKSEATVSAERSRN